MEAQVVARRGVLRGNLTKAITAYNTASDHVAEKQKDKAERLFKLDEAILSKLQPEFMEKKCKQI